MPLPDLLLGTRRLRREIDAQSQQLEQDIARVEQAKVQLRQTAVARITSPLGLLSALGVGFIAGKMAGRPAAAKPIAKYAIGSMAALTLNTVRAIGTQVALPLAIEWLQTRFAKRKNGEPTSERKTDSETIPQNQP